MPRGTTQVVTRGASNDWCQMCRWRLDQSACDTWHWRVSVRGTMYCSSPRWQDTSVRGTVQVAARPIRA
ncbi:hypothetical protein Tco_1314299 [Tanacetum coccineum]